MTVDTATEDDSIRAFSESARAFLEAKSPLVRLRAMRGTSPGFDKDIWRAMAEAGWTAMLAPESLGGLDLGVEAVSAIAQEVGRHPLPEPFIAGAVQAVAALCAQMISGRMIFHCIRRVSNDARERLIDARFQDSEGRLLPPVEPDGNFFGGAAAMVLQ